MNPIAPSSTDPNLSRWVDDLVSDSPRLADDVEALSSSFDRSNSLDLVDRFLDLGQGLDLTDLSKEELAEAFEVIAELLERGIVGYEVREINGAPHKVFIDVAIGSDLHRAPLWRNGRVDGYL